MTINDFKYFYVHHLGFRKNQICYKYAMLLNNSKHNQNLISSNSFEDAVDQTIKYLSTIKRKLITTESRYNSAYLFDSSTLDYIAQEDISDLDDIVQEDISDSDDIAQEDISDSDDIAQEDISDIYRSIKIIEDALTSVIVNQRDTSLIDYNTDLDKYFREDDKKLSTTLLTEPINRDNIVFHFSLPGQSFMGRLPLLVIQNQDVLGEIRKKTHIMDISELTQIDIKNEELEKNINQLNAENALMLNHFIKEYENKFFRKLKDYYHAQINQNPMKDALEKMYNQFDKHYQTKYLILNSNNSNSSKMLMPAKELFDPFISKFDYNHAPYIEVKKRIMRGKDSNLDYFYHDKEKHGPGLWDRDGRTFFRSIENLQQYYILETMYYMKNTLFEPWLDNIRKRVSTQNRKDEETPDFKKTVQGKRDERKIQSRQENDEKNVRGKSPGRHPGKSIEVQKRNIWIRDKESFWRAKSLRSEALYQQLKQDLKKNKNFKCSTELSVTTIKDICAYRNEKK